MTTAAYLEMPELFQLSVLSGSLAMLRHWAAVSGDDRASACYEHWTVEEDVLAILSLHARARPEALDAPFVQTLIEALAERCADPAAAEGA